MKYPIVGNIATRNIIYLDYSAILNDAIELITEHSIRNIVVHDKDINEYAYIGVDEIVHAITLNIDVNTPIVDVGLHPLISIPKEYNIFEASYFFIENESLLGVLDDDGELYGVLSFIDILTASMTLNKETLESPVRSMVYKNSAIMSEYGVYLNSLLESLDSMPTDCIVVHENNIPHGIITKRDITKRIGKGDSLNVLVETCMHSPVFTVNGNISVRQALEIVQENMYKRIFVVDDDENLLGIITQKELVSVIYHKVSHKAIVSMDRLNTLLEQRVSLKAEEIEELKDRYEHALSASSHGIWDWNILNDEVILSKQLQEMLSLNRNVLKMSQGFNSLIHDDDRVRVVQTRDENIEAQNQLFDQEYRLLDGNKYIWVKDRSKIIYHNSHPVRIVSTMTNISEYKHMQREIKKQKDTLYYQANYDTLTNLPNKTMFVNLLRKKIEESQKRDEKFALLFIDLDHFKEINDSLGHTLGDQVLQYVAQRIESILPKEYLLSRQGGDEFIIMTDSIKNEYEASSLAVEIIEVMKEPLLIGKNRLFISSSIGISFFPTDAQTCDDLLKQVDSAMYHAKANGRNSYAFYTYEMTQEALKRVEMETDLHNAIENDEFEVYFQPQFDIFKSKLIGLEALVRWHHPSKGFINPDEFISLAEDTGLIIPLDQIVMKKSMQQVQKWYIQGYKPGILALNLAMKQLHQENIIDIVVDCMNECSFKPAWLELEITESQIMKNPESSILKLEEISALGIEIAIDDFGTGYSSLAYLKKLPVNKLKIDRSFISDIAYNEEDAAITKTVIALAKSLNLKVIAEGVETLEHVEFLKEHGCENAQGYLYGKPMKAIDFEELLKEEQ